MDALTKNSSAHAFTSHAKTISLLQRFHSEAPLRANAPQPRTSQTHPQIGMNYRSEKGGGRWNSSARSEIDAEKLNTKSAEGQSDRGTMISPNSSTGARTSAAARATPTGGEQINASRQIPIPTHAARFRQLSSIRADLN